MRTPAIQVLMALVGAVLVGSACSAAPQAPAEPSPTATAAPVERAALPLPQVPPPPNKARPQTVQAVLEAQEVEGRVADGVAFTYWTFGGSVPGTFLRVREGDKVELTLRNAATNKNTHNIDLHAVNGPGGGGAVTSVAPGQEKTFRFKAMNPGLYLYHCATPIIPIHVMQGMYGLILVEPPEGLPKVDREFYVVQGELYLDGPREGKGMRKSSLTKLLDENADYVMFNGASDALTGPNALKARVGETVRIFFGVGGPNLASAFHVIGEIFDRVFPEAALSPGPATNVQTTLVPPGGATIVEFTLDVPGTYLLVDHALGRTWKGAAGQLVVEGPENPEVFTSVR